MSLTHYLSSGSVEVKAMPNIGRNKFYWCTILQVDGHKVSTKLHWARKYEIDSYKLSAHFHHTYNCKQKAFVPSASYIVKRSNSARTRKPVIGIG